MGPRLRGDDKQIDMMRRLTVFTAIIIATAIATSAAFAADMAIPRPAMSNPFLSPDVKPPAAAGDIPIQQNQPNCASWTDECVNCTRGAPGRGPTCSNIGFACQPKAIRCLSDIPQSEPRK
jgi:hypothetical protein